MIFLYPYEFDKKIVNQDDLVKEFGPFLDLEIRCDRHNLDMVYGFILEENLKSDLIDLKVKSDSEIEVKCCETKVKIKKDIFNRNKLVIT